MNDSPLKKLESLGQSLWMDFLRRGMLKDGEIARLIAEDGVSGITSNPSIFEKAIAGSHDYDKSIRLLALEHRKESEIYQTLTVDDIREAADCFHSVYERTAGGDGFVSLEVSPHLARDTEGTIAEARRLWAAVDRPNLMIKVPGTREGLPAIRRLIGEGINVNITLLFGLPRYREVAEAYIGGLEDRAAQGGALDRLASVASFFLSRIDVLLDPELEKIIAAGGEQGKLAGSVHGQTAIASAKLAYSIYHEIFTAPRFQALSGRGARTQRLLWASTSTKNPAYSDVKYVEPLIGPETINTMPIETITAYRDHGNPVNSLAEGLSQAQSVFDRLKSLGIDIDHLTQQLEDEGVDKFNQPFDRLMETIRMAREAALHERVDRQTADWIGYESRVHRRIEILEKEHFASRLWNKDPSLWAQDPAAQTVIRDALGWLHVAEKMSENVDDLSRFVSEVKAAGFRRVVHMGMGGSSMAPIVLTRIFPVAKDGLPVDVLDSTDPAAIRRIERENPVESTLFIVASKSGTTAEPLAYGDYFYAKVREKKGAKAGENFVAITDPGTPLADLAAKRGFRRVFLNYADIGGRYSALSYFGLLPAALMGLDVAELIERSLRMANACSAYVPEHENPGLILGAGLGELARAGRDKLTFLAPAALSSLGLWLEQLLAESTGKDGRGVLPVAGEPLGSLSVYGDDRCFAVFQLKGSPDPALERAAEEFRKAGFPVVTILLDDPLDVGQEFFRWEVATAVAGAVIGINAFDQPNVRESKGNTNRLLEVVRQTGKLPVEKPSLSEPPLELYAGEVDLSVPETIRSFLHKSQAGDYIAIQAYLPETTEVERELQAIRLRLRDRLQVATTVGYGPRFLHSTGQYHKGGPNNGLFLQLTADNPQDAPVPDAPYTFGVLEQAQALGDLQALAGHGRSVLRVHLGPNVLAGLSDLERIVAEALQPLTAGPDAKKKVVQPAAPRAKKAARTPKPKSAARRATPSAKKPKAKPKPAVRRRIKPAGKKSARKSKR
jgi:transaldolase/glucose-6-phosphate isomerase